MDDANALQIYLRSIHFDRPTTHTMNGYVMGLSQRNINGKGQLYISHGSFRVRRDNRLKTRDDEVYCWDGDGELIFSTKREGLELVRLELYFIRDLRRLRKFGDILNDMFGKDKDGSKIAKTISKAIVGADPIAGAIVLLTPKIVSVVGKILNACEDKVKIRAEGTLKFSTILADLDKDDESSLRKWGRSHADKGYFETKWDLVTMADPEAQVIRPSFTNDLQAEIIP